jgi:hypothetical protein
VGETAGEVSGCAYKRWRKELAMTGGEMLIAGALKEDF